MKLDREDMMKAVTEGVRKGIADLGSDWGRLDLPHEIVHDAIKQGVRQALGTLEPEEIASAIHEGAKEAFDQLWPSQIENAITHGIREAMKR